MPSARIVRSSTVARSARVLQLEGLFDLPPTKTSQLEWVVNLPLEKRPWQIGLIVGPSGCGKSTVARALFGPHVVTGYSWAAEAALVDAFPAALGIKEIVTLLSSVGFSSPPAWLRPFPVLSNGEQFRATLARALAEARDLVVFDEFTSVVDRTVARLGSAAVAKTIRRRGGRFVAISCHDDIREWLVPDWVYEPALNTFHWRSLRRRPRVSLHLGRASRSWWPLFRPHHYLSSALNRSARCYLARVEGRPAAFCAVLPFPHPKQPGWREHRLVCLPDFQGIGIGSALSEFVASLYAATGRPYRGTTAHPGLIAHRARSSRWQLMRPPGLGGKHAHQGLARTGAVNRLTAGFMYVGPTRPDIARQWRISN